MIKAKNIIMKERTWINRVAQRDSLSKSVLMRYESIGSREFDEHSESEFLVSTIEALRKNLAPKCNVKRSGGLILAECVGRLDTSQMTGRVSAG